MLDRRLARTTLAVSLTALVLAGCGMNPAATKRVKKKTTTPITRQQQLLPGQALPGQAGPQDPAVQQMLAGLRQAQARVPGFTATVETYDKGPTGKETTTMKVAYKKPSTLRIEMTKATGQAQGAKVLWTGGSSLTIKPSFLPMSVEKPVTDDMFKSKNGWTIRETEVNATFKVLLDPQAQIKFMGMQAVAGMQLGMFEVRSTASPKGATHEVVGINPATGLPGVRMLYKNAELIYQLTLKNLQVKSPSSSEMEI